jgi:hypothetical protein
MEMEEDSSSHRLWKWKRTIAPPLMETGKKGCTTVYGNGMLSLMANDKVRI